MLVGIRFAVISRSLLLQLYNNDDVADSDADVDGDADDDVDTDDDEEMRMLVL